MALVCAPGKVSVVTDAPVVMARAPTVVPLVAMSDTTVPELLTRAKQHASRRLTYTTDEMATGRPPGNASDHVSPEAGAVPTQLPLGIHPRALAVAGSANMSLPYAAYAVPLVVVSVATAPSADAATFC